MSGEQLSAQAQDDASTLDYHLKLCEDFLRNSGHPVTNRNIVHAMYECNMADWMNGVTVYPICDFEGQKWET